MEVQLRVVVSATCWLGSANWCICLYTRPAVPQPPCSALSELQKTPLPSVPSGRERAGYLCSVNKGETVPTSSYKKIYLVLEYAVDVNSLLFSSKILNGFFQNAPMEKSVFDW